jgi:SET domain-containing protein
MKDRLYFNSKIEIRKSSIHGWGIFAKEDIKSGEILEEVPFVILPISKGEVTSLLVDYRFNFPTGNWKWQVLPFGFAGLYNHSDNANAGWQTDEENEIFVFKTNRNINKNEEICTYYGDQTYWNDGRKNTIVK